MKRRLPAYLEAALFLLLTATVAWRIAADRSGGKDMEIEPPAESAAELLEQADEAYESMDMAGAATLYHDVLKRDPDNLRSRVQLAHIFLLNNWNANSIQLLDEVLERDLDHLEARLLFAKILRDEGRSNTAALVYESSLRVNPNNAEALYYLGTAYQAAGKFKEALGSYRRAIESDPGPETGADGGCPVRRSGASTDRAHLPPARPPPSWSGGERGAERQPRRRRVCANAVQTAQRPRLARAARRA